MSPGEEVSLSISEGGKRALVAAMQQALAEGVFPGAVLLVAGAAEVLLCEAFGLAAVTPVAKPTSTDTLYDLASLTKVVATTTIAMRLRARGRLDLDQPVSTWIPDFFQGEKREVRLRHLLAHAAGLPAWRPLLAAAASGPGTPAWAVPAPGLGYPSSPLSAPQPAHVPDLAVAPAILAAPTPVSAPGLARSAAVRAAARVPLDYPPGSRALYSDLDFVLLGHILEQILGRRLDQAFSEEVAAPLALGMATFVDLADPGARPHLLAHHRLAPSELLPGGQVLLGEVHDANCRAMGGIAGHAGLFAGATDVGLLAQVLLRAYAGENSAFIPTAVVREFWSRQAVPGSTFCLGWDTPLERGSSAGTRFSRHSVGHLSYTGCSLWIDLDRRLVVLLLCNRVHPEDGNFTIRHFRPLLHDLVIEAVG